MPRSRRRAGVKKGKTLRQMAQQADHDRRVAQNEAARRKAAKRLLEQRQTFAERVARENERALAALEASSRELATVHEAVL
jgi:hypothetical protein